MDYRRATWLLVVGVGLVFSLGTAGKVVAGSSGPQVAVAILRGLVVVGPGASALRNPDRFGGGGRSVLPFVGVLLLLLGVVVATAVDPLGP